MSKLKPGDLLRKKFELKTLPEIFYRLQEALDSPRTSSGEIGKIVADDPALTARLLRIVNSPFYAFQGKIDTVARAVTIIGTHQLRDLALATSIMQVFRNVPQQLVDMERFWVHSLACAVVAREVARERRALNIEAYFVSGLLHDIGSLVLYMQKEEESVKALERAKEGGIPVHEAEREIFDFDHAAVGKELLTLWNLPESQQDAVGYHHRPQLAQRFPLEAAAVHLADAIANALEWGSSGELRVPPILPDACATLGVPAEKIREIIDVSEQQLEEAVTLFLGA